MTILTTSAPSLLRPGLKSVFGTYDKYPSQWSEIFETHRSDKAVELDVEMKFTGLGQIRAEGAPTAVDSMGQRSITQYIHQFVALSFSISAQMIQDNLYKSSFPMSARALRYSLAQTKEVLAAAIFNNGFDPNYPIGDGQPLYSLNHPIDGGVVANTLAVSSDLNEASLTSAISKTQRFRDAAGLIVMVKPKKLLVSNENQFAAERLTRSQFRVGVNNNDVNVLESASYIPQGYRVNQFITLPGFWAIITDSPEGFKHFLRMPVETDVYTEFSTKNLLCSAEERYALGCSNFRATFGCAG